MCLNIQPMTMFLAHGLMNFAPTFKKIIKKIWKKSWQKVSRPIMVFEVWCFNKYPTFFFENLFLKISDFDHQGWKHVKVDQN
jgi:hypothetical protein